MVSEISSQSRLPGKKECGRIVGPSCSKGVRGYTYLVDHIGNQTFDFIRLDVLSFPELDCNSEFVNFDPRSSVVGIIDSCKEEHFPHQVSQTYVSCPFESEVDASFHELGLPCCKCLVEIAEIARTDGRCQRFEE